MLAQRPANSHPVVRAVAEALPFRDYTFDAALAVLTLHHWSDIAAGLREMRRGGPKAGDSSVRTNRNQPVLAK